MSVRPVVLILALALAACAPLRREPAEVALRVMTFNIHSGHGDLARTAETIRAADADVVALQEVDVRWHERSAFADQAAALGARTGMTVRFAPIYSQPAASGGGTREFGLALLTRHRVLAFRNDSMTRRSTQEPNATPAPAPGLLDATVEVRGARVRVLNVHLDYRPDPAVRVTQVAELLARVDASDAPTVVLGDMNARPDAPEIAPLRRRLRDAWAGPPGDGGTYPAHAPDRRIDYVLVSPQVRVRAAAVVATDASDHRPVVADLALPLAGSGRRP